MGDMARKKVFLLIPRKTEDQGWCVFKYVWQYKVGNYIFYSVRVQ